MNNTSPVVGDGIHPGSGNMMQSESDYSGGGSFPLTFNRSYNSQDVTVSGVMGAKWTHNYNLHIASSGTQAAAIRGDGKSLVFNQVGSAWQADGDVNGQLFQTTTGWKYKTAADQIEWYDNNTPAQLITIVNRAGMQQQLAYSGGQLASVTDPGGRQLTFTYTGARLWKMQDPAGNVTTYSYDGNGNLATVTWPDTKSRQYKYELSGVRANLMTGLVDETGTRFATWAYDSMPVPRAVCSVHAGSASSPSSCIAQTGAVALTQVSYDTASASNYLTVTQPNGKATRMLFDAANNTVRPVRSTDYCATCATSGPSLTAAAPRDVRGNVTAEYDYNGNQTVRNYNSLNLETSRVEAVNTLVTRTVTTQWDSTWRLPKVVQELNRQTIMSYDGTTGNLLSRTLSASGTATRAWVYSYTSSGQLASIKDTLNNTSSFGYTTTGDLSWAKNALGQTTTFTYNPAGRVASLTDPNFFVTTASYDTRQRLTQLVQGSATTTYTYYDNGLLKRVTRPDATYLEYSYNAAHQLIAVTGSGQAVRYTLDDAGNRVRTETANSAGGAAVYVETASYDYLGRMISRSASGLLSRTTTSTYDPNGNVISITDPLGRTATSGYDALNRLSRTVDALNNVTSYSYDIYDNLLSVTDPLGRTATSSYDLFDNRLTAFLPDSGTVTSAYNKMGNPISITNALGQTGTYSYDALNRVTQINYATAPYTMTYGYDATAGGNKGIGHLTSLIDGSATTRWVYNGIGQVTSKSQTTSATGANPAVTLTATWDYSATTLQLNRIVYPSGMNQYDYYLGNGRVGGIYIGGAAATAISGGVYQPFGPLASYKQDGAVGYTRTFNGDGTIKDITVGPLATPVEKLGLSYDPAGEITALNEGVAAATQFLSRTATYDLLSRVATYGVPSTGAYQNFAYDANGNITQQVTGAGTTAYTLSATNNRLLTLSGLVSQSASWNANGSMTKMVNGGGTYTPAYDARGRMTSVGLPGGSTTYYAINGLGQRVKKNSASTLPNVANEYFYDDDGHLLGIYDADASRIQEISYLEDTPVLLNMTGTHYFINTDHLDAPRSITTQANVFRWTWDKDLYGTTQPNGNPAGLGSFTYNLRYPGQHYDSETGLNYNMARDYNPAWGRYVQSDPIGLGGVTLGTFNTYGYAGNNPVMNADKLGLDIDQSCVGIATGCGMVIGGTLSFIGGGGMAVFSGGVATPFFTQIVGSGTALGGAAGHAMGNLTCPDISNKNKASSSQPNASTRESDEEDASFPSRKECQKIYKQCKESCIDKYVDAGGGLGQAWMGKCINMCMEENGCEALEPF